MPTTFRNLVVNDVVDQLRLPITRVAEYIDTMPTAAEAKENKKKLEEALAVKLNEYYKARKDMEDSQQTLLAVQKEATLLDQMIQVAPELGSDSPDNTKKDAAEKLRKLVHQYKLLQELDAVKSPSGLLGQPVFESLNTDKTSVTKAFEDLLLPQAEEAPNDTEGALNSFDANEAPMIAPATINDAIAVSEKALKDVRVAEKNATKVLQEATSTFSDSEEQLKQLQAELVQAFRDLSDFEIHSQVPTVSGRSRRARHPLPPSSITSVYGRDNLIKIATTLSTSYVGRHIRWNGCNTGDNTVEKRISVLDTAKWLDAETNAAYELLSDRNHVHIYNTLCQPDIGLAALIRAGDFEKVTKAREYFFVTLHKCKAQSQLPDSMRDCISECPPLESPTSTKLCEANTSVEALAWAIVVESALLNERLNQDVRKLAKAKQVYDLDIQRDYQFFLPDSVLVGESGLEGEFQLATEVFQKYVRERWPIHVFAVDPREQDQNVTDESQRKRELQFALALGFATGKIGASSLTQYSRMLETEIKTIGLNRTIVGFGHGADTFGWRFYPRVQALDVPGTLGSIRETICGASRDYDLRNRQIEPGQRECVAIVLMPSFVPYADFDIRSNWFKLTNPKNSALTMKDSVHLSRAVTAMRHSRAQCAQCQHLYRDGELGRLFKRVDQLERELPLQTQRALVPYENTLGGFEMFNTGVTDLSPELIGFYGAPGINTSETFNCGCYQSCGLMRPDCDSVADCEKLNAALSGINTQLAALATNKDTPQQPMPECVGKRD